MASSNQEARASIPTAVLHQFISTLRREVEAAERLLGLKQVEPAHRLANRLEEILAHPGHQWVGTGDAARILGKDEETIRRWCRTGTAPFPFRKKGPRYLIWLADLKAEVN